MVVPSYQTWQLQYFGCTNCPQAAPGADSDGTGQNNWFKYIAGLNPTNPASRFVVTAAASTNPVPAFNLTYGPLAPGRTYTPWFSPNLPASNWTKLTVFLGPITNAANATLTDTNSRLPARFYRLSISYP
jgi:hypothetical protein